ncbi:hypothetical protein B0T16DRAFT_488435 [Cercophora newfieldiana]|uniref:DUF1772-domain-containing protein n=1 Tax=Cercophora newfieldiana TaxID=92897 RepID=A0AA40D0I9_9PEZI|nr:hypothetical protein B0T16DRAFT_488435 [Cercophora newfieldiana]
MTTKPTPIRTAEITALLLSSTLTGLSLSYSTTLTPRLLESPIPIMLTQWTHAFAQGKKYMPPPAIAAGAAYMYLATRRGLANSRMYAYIAAAVLTVGIVPYTFGVMGRVNRMLEGRERTVRKLELELEGGEGVVVTAEERKGLEEEGAWVKGEVEGSRYLVDRWGMLNLGRAVMLGVGAVVGFVATI